MCAMMLLGCFCMRAHGAPWRRPTHAPRASHAKRTMQARMRPAPRPMQVGELLSVLRELPLSPAQARNVVAKAMSCAK